MQKLLSETNMFMNTWLRMDAVLAVSRVDISFFQNMLLLEMVF